MARNRRDSIIPAAMAVGFVRALRLLHHSFGHYPPAARAHILGRFLTCPFLRTLDLVPEGSRLLDIGAGHGLFPRLAVERSDVRVVALEPDLRKTFLPFHHSKVKWVAGFDDALRGTFDVVSAFDVAYRMSSEERERFYRRVFELLAPGGTFILKDMDVSSRLKMKWARFQELLSDRLLGITLGEGFYHETPESLRKRLEGIGFVDVAMRRIDAGYPHPHAVFTARKSQKA